MNKIVAVSPMLHQSIGNQSNLYTETQRKRIPDMCELLRHS